MIVIGLTGSIGMGKSTVAQMMSWLGVPIHDSDKAVHEALLPGGAAFEKVAAAFPESVEGGAISRKKLGEIVFHNDEKRKALESILHPAAQASQLNFIERMKGIGKKAICLEIPLLFETGAQERLDYTLCVTAPAAVQLARVMKRAGMTKEKFGAIVTAQMKDEEKRALADFIIDTGDGYLLTFFQVYKILREIKK